MQYLKTVIMKPIMFAVQQIYLIKRHVKKCGKLVAQNTQSHKHYGDSSFGQDLLHFWILAVTVSVFAPLLASRGICRLHVPL